MLPSPTGATAGAVGTTQLILNGFKNSFPAPGPITTQYVLTNQEMKNCGPDRPHLKAAWTAAAGLSKVRL